MYDLFSDFFNSFEVMPVYRESGRCPGCGRTYYDFQKTGRLGCKDCYTAFLVPVRSTLKRMQKSTVHTGKIPAGQSETLLKKRKIEQLKKDLSAAVEKEDYEQAAKLHKEIKAMEG